MNPDERREYDAAYNRYKQRKDNLTTLPEYERGWNAASRDLNDGLAHLGDAGFQPAVDDYQRGYNDRIEAVGGTDALGMAICIAIGVAIIGLLYLVLNIY